MVNLAGESAGDGRSISCGHRRSRQVAATMWSQELDSAIMRPFSEPARFSESKIETPYDFPQRRKPGEQSLQ